MRLGILGLPQSGKTTLFEILVSNAPPRAAGARQDRVGIVRVPDQRVDRLGEMYVPKKTTYATLEVVDSQAMGQGGGPAKGADLFAGVRIADALVLVVRVFEDASVPHPHTTVDAARDLKDLEAEILLNDMAIVETRLERIGKQMRIQKGQDLERESAVLLRAKEALDVERPLRELTFTREEDRVLRGFQLLSRKPLLGARGRRSRLPALRRPAWPPSSFRAPTSARSRACRPRSAHPSVRPTAFRRTGSCCSSARPTHCSGSFRS